MKPSPSIFPTAIVIAFSLMACNNESAEKRMADSSYTSTNRDASASLKQEQPAADSMLRQLESQIPSAIDKNDNEKTSGEDQNKFMQNMILNVVSSSAARAGKLDSTHRFIRTANMRFRVTNVPVATYRIEDITSHFGGWVADTKLESVMMSDREVPVSADSSLETMHYVVTNTMILRIPYRNLDTALKSLVPLIDYLDFRNINTNDITLNLLSNQLAGARLAKYNARMASDIDNKGKKLPDITGAEQSMLNSQEQADNALIDNLRMDDQVQYATVSLNIYQRETIRQELIKRERSITAYEPGLGNRLGESFMSGWRGFRMFLSAVVLLWPLWVIGTGLFFFISWLVRRGKKV